MVKIRRKTGIMPTSSKYVHPHRRLGKKDPPGEIYQKRPPKELTGGIILSEDLKEILLIRGRVSGKWGLPKGHKEPGETYLEGAIREIREETGLNIKLLVDVLPCILSKRAKLFLLTFPKKFCHLNPQDTDEIQDIKWVPIRDLITLQNQTRMLKSIWHRMDHIKDKIRKNCENYPTLVNTTAIKHSSISNNSTAQSPIKFSPGCLVLNIGLWIYLFPHLSKPIERIVAQVQKDFPKLFYEPELRAGIQQVQNNLGLDFLEEEEAKVSKQSTVVKVRT